MKKIIHFNPDQAGKLHCDACSYDLPQIQAFTESLIGTPCPKCGADMLTRKDYESAMKMFKFIDWMNKWFGWLGSETILDGKGYAMSVKTHDGETQIKYSKR